MNKVDTGSIVLVSGLPRSGTSMMMRILEAGGIEALTDRVRTADLDNPRGYYEFEAVKRTRQDSSWLELAKGKVVKLISKLLLDLPDHEQYKVVFMLRSIPEVLSSQRKMMERSGKSDSGVSDDQMAAIFTAHLNEVRKWIDSRENIEVLYVNYNDLMADPRTVLGRISSFVAGLDMDSMERVIDSSLYRNREKS